MQAIDENYIPYEPTLGQFITADEAAKRYDNLGQFYSYFGHFWVGNGPLVHRRYLPDREDSDLGELRSVPRSGDKMGRLCSSPSWRMLKLMGQRLVTAGEEAVFDIYVTFDGDDYPLEDIDNVKYLIFDATGAMVEVGAAVAVEDGLFQITLSGEQTGP